MNKESTNQEGAGQEVQNPVKSKCRRINRVDFKRTDFDEFVTNVKNGYQCMSPEYRHFGTYSLATMSKFSRFLYLKPSIVKTLTHLSMNSVDWLNTEEDVTEVGFICHLIGRQLSCSLIG